MGGAALGLHPHRSNAGGAKQQRFPLGHGLRGRRLARQHYVVLIGARGEDLARIRGADLLVGVDQHGERGVVLPARVGEVRPR